MTGSHDHFHVCTNENAPRTVLLFPVRSLAIKSKCCELQTAFYIRLFMLLGSFFLSLQIFDFRKGFYETADFESKKSSKFEINTGVFSKCCIFLLKYVIARIFSFFRTPSLGTSTVCSTRCRTLYLLY